MADLEFDDSQWPIAITVIPGEFTLENAKKYISKTEERIARAKKEGRKIVLIGHDTGRGETMGTSAEVRKVLVDWLGTFDESKQRVLAGNFIVTGPWMRLMFTAMKWIAWGHAGKVLDGMDTFASFDTALAEARKRLVSTP